MSERPRPAPGAPRGPAQLPEAAQEPAHAPPEVTALVQSELAPLCERIDRDGHYPRRFIRLLGEAHGFDQAVSVALGGAGRGVNGATAVIEEVAATCASTGFCTWCQIVCAYYVQHGRSPTAIKALLPQIVSGRLTAGTALSNAIKHLAGIEPARISATRAGDGSLILDGAVPWISNVVQQEGCFGALARLGEGQYAMLIVPADAPGVSFRPSGPFIALEGSSTYTVRIRQTRVAAEHVLADPASEFIDAVRPGFVLMQCGLGLGLARACIAIMRRSNRNRGPMNRHLADGPEAIASELARLRRTVFCLGAQIGCGAAAVPAALEREILAARLAASELSLRAATAAMLHAGPAGYRRGSTADRRVREAFFVSMVTPSVKHLRRLLSVPAQMAAAA